MSSFLFTSETFRWLAVFVPIRHGLHSSTRDRHFACSIVCRHTIEPLLDRSDGCWTFFANAGGDDFVLGLALERRLGLALDFLRFLALEPRRDIALEPRRNT